MNLIKTRSLIKRYPTLSTGIVVLLTVVVLLGGRTLVLKFSDKNVELLQNKKSVNSYIENVVAFDNKNNGTEQNAIASVKDGVQYVTSSIYGGQYEPITVKQGIPVKWTLNAPSGSLNGCNNSIIIPKYNLQVELKTGENIIEFTPDESGVFPFSCWMGMIRSNITVVDEDGTVADNPDDGSGKLPAGCCGGIQ